MENTFFTVIRQYMKGTNETHSMEVFTDRQAALQRYFNIIAADLATADITYQAAYVIDKSGLMIEGRVFDRAAVETGE